MRRQIAEDGQLIHDLEDLGRPLLFGRIGNRLGDDPPSRPGSPFENEVVEAMEAFDENKEDVVNI